MTKNKPPREKFHDGTYKTLYFAEEDFLLSTFFKDTVKLENGETTEVSGKGILKNTISSFLMEKLDLANIDHHFIEKLNMREQLVQMVDIIPMKISISYIACGRYISEFGFEPGFVFDKPMIDFQLKRSNGFRPIVNEDQISHFYWMPQQDIEACKNTALRAADFLSGFFAAKGIRLVSSTFELGRVFDGEGFLTMIAGEISPDTCRLWDLESNAKLDFEHTMINPEDTIDIYKTIVKKLGIN
jgi:phosphoribosylaminoimidazole-succinocarboxamide synthase